MCAKHGKGDAMRCKNLAMRVLAAEILCDVLPRCENTSDAMPRCRPLSFWGFPDFSGIFPICPGIVRGLSRFVVFLCLSAAIFAICDCDAHRGPQKAMPHCDLRVRWKVASDVRFRAAISEPKTPSFCGISGDLAQSTRKSLAIAIVRFWCAKSSALFI